jgi:hypothetical protein
MNAENDHLPKLFAALDLSISFADIYTIPPAMLCTAFSY